jgi:bifunctional DNA-binding transcriptional regulator/antitoxin component of YhaV-PrlF toxin-antitoxin module
MAVATIRAKNQVTLPRTVLDASGLQQGDQVEFETLSDGRVAVWPYGDCARRRSALAVLRELAAIPGLADIDFEAPRLDGAPRDVEW